MKNFEAEKERKKLKEITKRIPEQKRKLVEGLIADASFMAEQLEILRDHIIENGWAEEYQNGANQRGRKNTVEAEMYIKLQKSYASVIRQLTDVIDENAKAGEKEQAGEKLMEFLAKGKSCKVL